MPRDLTICPECHRDLVYPIDWVEATLPNWRVTLRCPNCEWREVGLFDQATLDRFDTRLDELTALLVKDMDRFTRSNMLREADRLAAALGSGLVLPEDF